MSDMMAAISYDEKIYEDRCIRFNETPEYKTNEWGIRYMDIYGEHGKKLEELDKEIK